MNHEPSEARTAVRMRCQLAAVGRGRWRALLTEPLCLALLLLTLTQQAQAGNWWLGNIHIVDGTGKAAFRGAIEVEGDRILTVRACEAPAHARDGGGLLLAPGFIDTHSHVDMDLADQPLAEAAVSQGITTVVVGQDGSSNMPLQDWFERWERQPAAINLASYAGHNTLRERTMGSDSKRPATEPELLAMERLLHADMKAGALGLATGLEYEPGLHASFAEVLRLAQLTASQGGRYISHLRSEDRWFPEAVEEIIRIGQQTGMPVQISHIKLAMKSAWGTAPTLLARLDQARAEGVEISADLYPYRYWQSNMMVLVPSRDLTAREEFRFALQEISPPDGFWLTHYAPEPSYVGMTLTQIADQRGASTLDTFMALAAASVAWESRTGAPGDSMIGTSMTQEDIDALLQWPHTNVCTDGALRDLHPRARGSFPRILGRYVRERGLLALPVAIHKMTGLSARHMGFRERGLIRAGMKADFILFDPDTVMDHATPDNSQALSTGIEQVWVNGASVWQAGASTGHRPGQVIRRSDGL